MRFCLDILERRYFSSDLHTLLAVAGQVKGVLVRVARRQRKLRHQQQNQVCDGGHRRGTDVTESYRQRTTTRN